MKNEELVINRAIEGDCPICGKNITDKKTLKPIAEVKPATFEGFKVFICAHHPNVEVEHAVSA